MNFSLQLLENSQTIQKSVLTALLPEVKNYMDKAINTIKRELPGIISESIISEPEYGSLLSGQLKFELGIPDAGSKISNLINIWISNMVLDYRPPTLTNSNIRSSFSAKLIRTNFSDVLGTDDAYVNDSLRGYSLPWLEWLLLDGTAIVVPNYEVVMGNNPRSRTGSAVMKISSDSWKVPDQFSGTISDNWITRAISNSQDKIQKLLERALKV
jgi:predicted P-loop ATPase/GTPase